MENISIIPAIRTSHMVADKASIIIRITRVEDWRTSITAVFPVFNPTGRIIIIRRKVVKTINTGIMVPSVNWDPESRIILKEESNAGLFNMKLKKEVSKLEGEFITKSLMGIAIIKQPLAKQVDLWLRP